MDILNLHGQAVTFRRVVNAGYDPTTGAMGTSSDDDETVKAHFQMYNDVQYDGTFVQRGDRLVILAPEQTSGAVLTKTPQVGDKILGEQDEVVVVNARPYMSGSTVVVWLLQVRE